MYKNFFKRFFDICISGCLLIILLPVFLLLILCIRKNLGKPVIFKQERVGMNGEIFTLYKFRTMTDEKDSQGQLLPDKDRITKFGHFLRFSSLDELPELWNILKGDMSVIGPRPLLVRYLPYYTEREFHRHDVRPGLTGLAQVNGRNSSPWEVRFAYDLSYVNNISLIQDVKIIFLTIKKVIFKEGIVVHEDNNVKALDIERRKGEV